MRTEVPFTLPQGYADAAGKIHREGVMRLATARDEIEPLRDASVRTNGAYLSVLLLARTVTRLGDLEPEQVTPDLIQDLYAVDFDHLQRLYERVNSSEEVVGTVTCPTCSSAFEVDLAGLEDGGLGG
jgi:hypothetical protein